jgi:starch synthase (maltosyl-transferring)
VDNDQILAYSKHSIGTEPSDAVLVVVNLDPLHTQSGWVELDPRELGMEPAPTYGMHDLLTDARYRWDRTRNFVMLDPSGIPAHVFNVESTDEIDGTAR